MAPNLSATLKTVKGNAVKTSTTALLDQADAATMHSLRTLHATAKIIDGTVSHLFPGPITEGILDRLRTGLMKGTAIPCDHLSPTSPQPAFWAPWAPGKIRCGPCATRAHKRIKGTPEDYRCDRCRRHMVTVNHVGVQLPAVVIDLAPVPPFSLPPIQVHLGLCSRCKQIDQAGQSPAT